MRNHGDVVWIKCIVNNITSNHHDNQHRIVFSNEVPRGVSMTTIVLRYHVVLVLILDKDFDIR